MLWWTLRQLRAKDPARRRRAAEKLGASKETRSVGPLLVALKDRDAGVQAAAASALGMIRDVRAVEPLMALLNQAKTSMRQAAINALAAISAAGAVEPLVELLKDDNEAVRKAALAALKKIGSPAVEPLTKALASESSIVRASAADGLKSLRWKPATDIERAQLAIAQRQWDEAVALGATAIAPLANVLKDEKGYIEKKEAAYALGKVGDARAIAPLTLALEDETSYVRDAAISALGVIGDARAVEPLTAILKKDSPSERLAAAAALRKLGPVAATSLVAALMDESSLVRKIAANALESFQWQPRDDIERALLAVAQHRWEDAVKLGSAAIEPLALAVRKNEDKRARLEATEALGRIEDQRTAEVLIEVLKKDEWVLVKEKAAQALGSIGDSRAFAPLLKSVRDEATARAAVAALHLLLERCAHSAETKDLRTVVDLTQVKQVFFHSVNVCENVTECKRSEYEIDCAPIRQLARQELIRRGRKA